MKLWSILSAILFAALLLAFAASGSVPPMPVIRPAPLQSPRAASVPKSTPMFKPASVPLTEPAPVSWMEITPGLNLSGCDTNDPNCRLWFNQHYSTIHPAGYELTVRLADIVTAEGGGRLAFFGAGSFDRISEFNWPVQEPQPAQRYFKRILTLPILPASRTSTSAPVIWANTNLGVTAWSRKK